MHGFTCHVMRLIWPKVLFAALLITFTAQAAPFGHGHVTVLRVVSDSGVLTNVTTPVFLDEYATNGTLVQTIPLPSLGSNAFVLSGNAVADGAMTRTANGRWLCLAG